MTIEILDSNGVRITLVSGVVNAPKEFNEHYKAMYNATSWQEYVVPQVDPSVTLANAQQVKKATINSNRDAKDQGGYLYLSKILDSDPSSVQRIAIAVQAAQTAISEGQDFSLDWTCQDNSILTMTAQQIVGMSVALAQHANTIHQHAKTLKDQVKTAITIEGVNAVTDW